MIDKITYFQHRQSDLMNDSYLVGIKPIKEQVKDSLFDGQRVLESQFLNQMPLLILHVAESPADAIHVANDTYLIPSDIIENLDDIEYFLVNQPFLKMVDKDVLEIYEFLYNISESLVNACNETLLIGCVQ